MAAHLPPNHDVHDADRDALAWLKVQLGSEPWVPDPVRERGIPAEIIAAALARLDALSHVGRSTPDFRDSRGVYACPGTPTSHARNQEPQQAD
jgi:hypothetical protein